MSKKERTKALIRGGVVGRVVSAQAHGNVGQPSETELIVKLYGDVGDFIQRVMNDGHTGEVVITPVS